VLIKDVVLGTCTCFSCTVWTLKHKFSHHVLKKSDPIVIIFGTNISDITGHQNLTQLLLLR